MSTERQCMPNFLHLGPSKTGSTWLHEVLTPHPEVFLSPAKDLYYFSRYHDRPESWYVRQFRQAPAGVPVIGEICPDYFMSDGAPARILECLGPRVRLMVTVRDPVERAFSAYLYLRRQGLANGSFWACASEHEDVLLEGRYGFLLRRYLQYFSRDRLHIGIFDDLQARPQSFLDGVTDFLGVERAELTHEQMEPVLAASRPRSAWTSAVARRGADWVRRHNGASIVGTVKRSGSVQKLLYREFGKDRPVMAEGDRDLVREALAGDIDFVEREFGLHLQERWGW